MGIGIGGVFWDVGGQAGLLTPMLRKCFGPGPPRSSNVAAMTPGTGISRAAMGDGPRARDRSDQKPRERGRIFFDHCLMNMPV